MVTTSSDASEVPKGYHYFFTPICGPSLESEFELSFVHRLVGGSCLGSRSAARHARRAGRSRALVLDERLSSA